MATAAGNSAHQTSFSRLLAEPPKVEESQPAVSRGGSNGTWQEVSSEGSGESAEHAARGVNRSRGSSVASSQPSSRGSIASAEPEFTDSPHMGSLTINFDEIGAGSERRPRGGAGGPTAVHKAGYLNKQNPRGVFGLAKGWKNRWFELNDQNLCYYDSQSKRESLRTVELSKIKSVGRAEVKGRQSCFEVATNIFLSDGSPRIFILQAESEEEANEWVRGISSNRTRLRSHSFSRSPSHDERQSVSSEQQHNSHSSRESITAAQEAGAEVDTDVVTSHHGVHRSDSNVSEVSCASDMDSSTHGRRRFTSQGHPIGSSQGPSSGGPNAVSPMGKSTKGLSLFSNLPGSKSLSSGTHVIKTMVSKQKRRFVEDGFNLDLAYITPRIIAMGFPSEGVEGSYRNHISEVYRFFETRHPDKYMIFNLCSERSYDPAKFHDRVICFPFDDHNPPPFEMIRPLCRTVERFLAENEEHVVAVHCKAGKGRTGVMIVSCLLHLGLCGSADEALQFYAQKRTYDGKGVTIRSQKRYCRYFAENLHTTRPLKYLCLNKVRLTDPPPGFTSVVVRVYNGQTQLTFLSRGPPARSDSAASQSEMMAAAGGGQGTSGRWGGGEEGRGEVRRTSFSESEYGGDLEVDCQSAVVSGDVHIVVGFRSRSQGGSSWFYSGQKDGDSLVSDVWFHTSFVNGNTAQFHCDEIDGAPRKDKRHEKFRASFAISVVLSDLPAEGGGLDHRVHHPDSGLSGGVTASAHTGGTLPKIKKEAVSSNDLPSASDLAFSLGVGRSESSAATGELRTDGTEDPSTLEAAGCGQAIVLYDFKLSTSTDDDPSKYLSLRTNDVVTILKRNTAGWWLGLFKGQIGWFPARYCVEIEGEMAETPLAV